MTDEQIELLWKSTFSTSNPFCPCDLRTFTKAARAVEAYFQRASDGVTIHIEKAYNDHGVHVGYVMADQPTEIPCPAHGLPCVRRPHCAADECKDQQAASAPLVGEREALQALYDVVIEQNRRGAHWDSATFGKMMAALAEARTILASKQPAASEREGWKLVPIEPTPEMLRAVDDEADDKYLARGRAVSAYKAMIAAAPSVGET